MGYMKWCCFWNTVYDGTIASAIHMIVSTLTYIGMCFGLLSFATYYGGDRSSEMAADYREKKQRAHFEAYHTENAGITSEEDHEVDEIDFEFHRELYVRPLLKPYERDLYVYSSLVMMAINLPILITSLLLLLGAISRKPRVMFLWVLSMVPYLIIDTAYHSFLFYSLLGFEDMAALKDYVFFQLGAVTIILFWVFRCAFDVYAILCVMALRNEITRSGNSKVRNIEDSEAKSPVTPTLSKRLSKKNMTLSAIAKSGLGPTASIFSSAFTSQVLDEGQTEQLDALHNAAATADIQQQLLLMSAAQHLAASSGLMAPSTALPIDANLAAAQQAGTTHLPANKMASVTAQPSNPPSLHASQPNLIDFTSTASATPAGSVSNLSQAPLRPQISSGSAVANMAKDSSTRATNLANAAITQMRRPPTGWGMSKQLLMQQQQALAIASGLQKSGLLPANTPLATIVKLAQEQQRMRQSNGLLKAPGSVGADGLAVVDRPLTSHSKLYAKQWLRMTRQEGVSDFNSQEAKE